MRQTCYRFVQSVSVCAWLALACAGSRAAPIVDTDTPTGDFLWTLGPSQSLAATFSLSSATVIQTICGYIDAFGGAGSVRVDLIAGDSPAGAATFSTSASVTGGESWKRFGGLGWAIGPGTYTTVFSTADRFGMRTGAPNSLSPEWFSLSGNWRQFDDLDIGLQVSSVPEPQTPVLMLCGLALLTAVARRRPAGV
jgi:PEP-CTERM motif